MISFDIHEAVLISRALEEWADNHYEYTEDNYPEPR
jgi:hypothetical protein